MASRADVDRAAEFDRAAVDYAEEIAFHAGPWVEIDGTTCGIGGCELPVGHD